MSIASKYCGIIEEYNATQPAKERLYGDWEREGKYVRIFILHPELGVIYSNLAEGHTACMKKGIEELDKGNLAKQVELHKQGVIKSDYPISKRSEN